MHIFNECKYSSKFNRERTVNQMTGFTQVIVSAPLPDSYYWLFPSLNPTTHPLRSVSTSR